MHFSFNRRLESSDEAATARETALRDLDEYIGVLVTQPEIRERLAQATADFQRTMDDEGLARQQKMRAMDEDLTRRLAALSESSRQARPRNATSTETRRVEKKCVSTCRTCW